ncbi:spermatogenesis-associated protein 46 [Pteronotus mesoamericanus]|uniref:spermatogenesis-associated protein 46 n=1 Tax=Pteronotus mesoamericanus TaxID=1884717 RepID=UPI0023ED1588|nr:spermatogenesis-associated protein 46 [Pteronotus parnellii mesoamericanus]
MERFSLLSLSGARTAPSAPTAFPGLTSPRATSLPDIAKPVPPTEAPSPAQAPPLPPHTSSALRPGVVLSPGCALGDPQDGARPQRSCTIYRPWFSPYSYFVCLDQGSRPEARGLPELPWGEGRGDGRLPEDAADSACSSSSSPEHTGLRAAAAEPRPGPDASDHITSQDLLRASRGLPTQQGGFKCVACCRMYPTLGSLRSHVRCGFREGFSCRVFYRKLKALWAQPADWLSSSSGGCRAHT